MSTPDGEQRPPRPDRPDVGLAFGPREILGGFALLAALILFLLRRRGRGPGGS